MSRCDPLRSKRYLRGKQRATPKEAQHPPACVSLHAGNGRLVHLGRVKAQILPLRAGQALDDTAMEVQVAVERRAETVDKAQRAKARRVWRAVSTGEQRLLDFLEKDP